MDLVLKHNLSLWYVYVRVYVSVVRVFIGHQAFFKEMCLRKNFPFGQSQKYNTIEINGSILHRAIFSWALHLHTNPKTTHKRTTEDDYCETRQEILACCFFLLLLSFDLRDFIFSFASLIYVKIFLIRNERIFALGKWQHWTLKFKTKKKNTNNVCVFLHNQ